MQGVRTVVHAQRILFAPWPLQFLLRGASAVANGCSTADDAARPFDVATGECPMGMNSRCTR